MRWEYCVKKLPCLFKELLKKYHEDVERLNKDRSTLLDEFERTKQELVNKLSAAETEVQN